jgi:hypothetical protein
MQPIDKQTGKQTACKQASKRAIKRTRKRTKWLCAPIGSGVGTKGFALVPRLARAHPVIKGQAEGLSIHDRFYASATFHSRFVEFLSFTVAQKSMVDSGGEDPIQKREMADCPIVDD